MTWLTQTLTPLDATVTAHKTLWLQFDTQNISSELTAVWLTASMLSYAWARRRKKEAIILRQLQENIKTEASFMTSSNYHCNVGTLALELMQT